MVANFLLGSYFCVNGITLRGRRQVSVKVVRSPFTPAKSFPIANVRDFYQTTNKYKEKMMYC